MTFKIADSADHIFVASPTLIGKNLEKQGVQPDILVNETFKDRLDGKNPQLDRALLEIEKQLKKE